MNIKYVQVSICMQLSWSSLLLNAMSDPTIDIIGTGIVCGVLSAYRPPPQKNKKQKQKQKNLHLQHLFVCLWFISNHHL